MNVVRAWATGTNSRVPWVNASVAVSSPVFAELQFLYSGLTGRVNV